MASPHHMSIVRGNDVNLSISISNSRVVDVDEKAGNIHEIISSGSGSDLEYQEKTLERGLKSRHVQLIAIGGAIGTGLFVGSSVVLTSCGPASLFLAYCIMSTVIYFVMQMLAEMTTFLPLPGNGPQAFVNDYLSHSFGFAIGYNYWYAFSILVAAEITAAALVIQYWTTKVNIAVWITILLALMISLNLISVKFFGESEFWFASIKLFALMGLIILGVVLFFGGGPNHDRLGFRYWKHDAFKEHLVKGSTGRFLGFWTALIKSGFAFICSPELVSTAGGECYKPRRNLPKAARRFIYRLAFFYVLGTLIIGVIVSSNDKKLINAGTNDASGSPFVIGIQNAGIPVLNHIINAVILTSATSAGNSFLYSSSRALFSIAQRGSAPRIFTTVNRFGVPYYAVAASSSFGFLSYLNCSSAAATVFTWFSNISTMSGFISWLTVTWAYLRWRKAIDHHNLHDRVTFRTPLQPYGAYYVLFVISLITITNGYAVFLDFNIGDFLAAYITFPIILVLYFGHRIYEYKVHNIKNWFIPIEKIDLVTGLDLVEEEDATSPEPIPRNFIEKIWYWIA
ncbi:putative proline permease [Spathaspora passalidarum NRRL Y-27907]|uniref:Putative proline permease n=1 Tax=Spathaspora passalidarum (strain NRRL Y-27907 / 11-Y1) TaxID=619300 RepID=G3AP78_SPAPN|nr:putative proline permease [Spathaspora passalidarum NRRL Y-27907]EGW32649.1 putative proline permease [Spathaspora passalidarum NRRL Y-27907]